MRLPTNSTQTFGVKMQNSLKTHYYIPLDPETHGKMKALGPQNMGKPPKRLLPSEGSTEEPGWPICECGLAECVGQREAVAESHGCRRHNIRPRRVFDRLPSTRQD